MCLQERQEHRVQIALCEVQMRDGEVPGVLRNPTFR